MKRHCTATRPTPTNSRPAPSLKRSRRHSLSTRAWCTISSTPTITRRWRSAVSLLPTNTPRLLPPPRTPSTCPRTPIRCSDYGRNQSSPIQSRGRLLRRWRPRRGPGQPTPASRTCWISWNTHSCKWVRSNVGSWTGLAAVPARFALERQAWKEAAVLEPRGSQYPQAEAITYFARALGSARSGDLTAADRELGKLKELRAMLEKANQSYWAEQVEIQMLAASAWIAHAKGQEDEALKFMRAAADVEDNSEKHIAMENRLYPMRELLGDLLLEQQQPEQALNEYETSFQSTPNRLRGLYGAAKAALGVGQSEKAATYFSKLAELTKNSDSDRAEIREARAFTARQ